MESIFGLVLALEPKTKRAKYHPATIYYQNKIITAKRGHRDAAPGKWVCLKVSANKATIVQVMMMNFVKTRFYSRTDFKIYTLFTVVDEKTVHNTYCGRATVVPEQRELIRNERMVYGSARLNSKWTLTFKASPKPSNNEFGDFLLAPLLPPPVHRSMKTKGKKSSYSCV
uniref:Tub domain-containing protein n=1 Tax=Panagrellus redivivus TaxID=6233 RepID=A0A7E4W2A8_PANRE